MIVLQLIDKLYKNNKITFVIATVVFTQINYNKLINYNEYPITKNKAITVFTV
jgi:hypothetical protein